MERSKQRLTQHGAIALRGLMMGAADVVPGVSGGTVALITGIYHRLITAISHVDLTLLGYIRRRKLRQAARHVDLLFLCTLLLGIAAGFLCMTLVIHELLKNPRSRELTFAAFFGMILASGILVAKMVHVRNSRDVVVPLLLGIVGTCFAWWLTTVKPHGSTVPSYPYLFLCGSIAICAMILPGISGAMITLILGVYEFMTKIPGNLLRGENVGPGLLSIAAFGSGAIFSLIGFSKILRRVLDRFPSPTMGLLCGLMLGALRALWPFQEKVADKPSNPVMPETIDGHVLAAAAIALAGLLLVLAVDRFTGTSAKPLVDNMDAGSDDAAPNADTSD